MLTVTFAHFKRKARIFTREEDTMNFSEATITRLLLANVSSIIRRCRKKLDREWPSFEQDHGVDPFAAHARIELYLDDTKLFTGRWVMCIYWVPDNDDWAGMHLSCEGAFIWPLDCQPVY